MREGTRLLLGIALLGLAAVPAPVRGGWLVDEARWHASGHGRMLCSDCHAEIARRPRHPDPGRFSGADFDAGRCAACHAEAFEELTEARHAGKPIDPAVDHRRCIACHDLHAPAAGAAGAPVSCARCHEERKRLPALPAAEEACLACHRLRDPSDPQAAADARRLCLSCHGGEDGTAGEAFSPQAPPRLRTEPESFRPHAAVSCLACHRGAARYAHGGQPAVDCLACHVRHDERVAHDAHLAVSCTACHREGVEPRRDRESGRVTAVSAAAPGGLRHDLTAASGEGACRRCHYPGNGVGAAAATLPPKGVLCIPCHPGTLTAADAVSRGALVVFGLGIAGSLFLWLGAARGGSSGTAAHAAGPGPGPRRPGRRVTHLALEGLLQRGLYRQAPGRWLIHALIAWPIGLRCLWGLAALGGSLWLKERAWPWALLDRNAAAGALFFDLTGLALLAGTAAALLRRVPRSREGMPGLPGGAWAGSALLGGIAAAGFLLEGMRLAMSGNPPGSALAFVGDGLSRLFHGRPGLEELYVPAWYVHATLAGIFAAWVPFGPMFHILLAPVLIAIGTGDGGVRPATRKAPPGDEQAGPGRLPGRGGDDGDRRLPHAR